MKNSADFETINIGTGSSTSIKRVASILTETMKSEIEPHISLRFRKWDIRSCFADLKKAQNLLDYKPTVSIENGLTELVDWIRKSRRTCKDLFPKALNELENKWLLK